MSESLFHLLPHAAGLAFLAEEGDWEPPSLASEGFVHLSFAHQVPGTLEVHYADTARMILVDVERASLEPDLRLEPSRGGALFPHLYRPLRRREVRRWWELERGPDGWELPDALRDEAGQGESGAGEAGADQQPG